MPRIHTNYSVNSCGTTTRAQSADQLAYLQVGICETCNDHITLLRYFMWFKQIQERKGTCPSKTFLKLAW